MPASCAGATLVRLVTWNIHGGIGLDGQYNAARVIAVLRELHADVVALQEVAALSLHAGFLKQVSDALDVRIVVGRTLTRRDADYGNALLSRFPVISSASIELSVRRHEPRNAIDAKLDVHGSALRVMATHLGLRPAERREQVQRILRAVDAAPHVPTVLMGDLNEWYLWGRPLRWLHARFRATPAPASFPARRPVLALDRIWGHPAESLSGVRAHRSSLTRAASDHLPVIGLMAIPSPASAQALAD
jgi:endonuclease/exonuclease/phosphatase family metal-dependent hydrolase